MVSERKFLDSEMEAELHFLELIDRGIENQKDTSRKLDTLNKQLQEIKEMVTAITSRLPAPTSPLHTPEVSNPSISSSKTTLKFDAPPDLAGSGNLMNDDDLLVDEVLENDDDVLKHDEKRAPMGTITESNVGKRAADLVAHQVFEEMPETQQELKQAKLKAPEMTDLKNASLLLLIRSESAVNSEMVARKMFEDMPREKEPPQIQIRDELNVENEISCLEARQVFGEMLELQQKLKQPKLKVFEVNSLQNATSSLLVKNHVLLNEFSPSVDYLRKMCFDPGGSSLLNVVYSPNRKCVLRDNGDLWCIDGVINLAVANGNLTAFEDTENDYGWLCFDPRGEIKAGKRVTLTIFDGSNPAVTEVVRIKLFYHEQLIDDMEEAANCSVLAYFGTKIIDLQLFCFDPGGDWSLLANMGQRCIREWFNTCFAFGVLHMNWTVINCATRADLLSLNEGWKNVIESALKHWKEFDGRLLREASQELKKNAPQRITSRIILFTWWSTQINIAMEMGGPSKLTLMMTFPIIQAWSCVMDATYSQIKATDLGFSEDFWAITDHDFKRRVFDPGAAAKAPGSNVGTHMIFVFDPGGVQQPSNHWYNAVEMSKFETYLCMILGDKDPLKRGVLMQDFGIFIAYLLIISYSAFLALNPVHSGSFYFNFLIQSGLSRFRVGVCT